MQIKNGDIINFKKDTTLYAHWKKANKTIRMTALTISQITKGRNQIQLKATKVPASTTEGGRIIWTSSNTNIAKVDNNGLVTAKTAGTVTITASCAGKTASINITFNNWTNVTPHVSYKVIEGADSFWVQGATNNPLTFRANGDISKFKNIEIDGKVVNKNNYIVKSGSTIVTFNGDYAKTLSVGRHKLTFIYADGECSTYFTVKEGQKDNGIFVANTSDETQIVLWFALMIVACGGLASIMVHYRKTRRTR